MPRLPAPRWPCSDQRRRVDAFRNSLIVERGGKLLTVPTKVTAF